ncbi:MAG: HYR domain-containing protein [Cyclobacteriaceae bacterium]|nr:HYR domain-containing protein [Cyclobacteriaceae bacterium]
MYPRYYFLGSVRWLIFLLLALVSGGIAAQTCDCPPANACGVCTGGLTELTFKYSGASSASVTIEDNSGIFFSSTLTPNEEFSISGSLPNGRFQGPSITIKIAAVTNVVISANCSSSVFAGETYGSFKVIAGASLGGGVLCCAPTATESVPPVISNCPGDINEVLGASLCTKGVSWTVPSATDNCGLASFTSNHNPGEQFPAGVTVVTYTATDNYGNIATCSFNVVVSDNEQPKFTSCPENITITSGTTCNALATWNAPLATDNCGLASVTSSHVSGEQFPLGTTTVTYTATDVNGNVSTCSFNVIVADQEAPKFVSCPADVVVSAEAGCETVASWTVPTATDNCSLSNVTSNFTPGSNFPIGTTEVIYTASDVAGNTSRCSFLVVVNSNVVPVFSNCPNDITIQSESLTQPIVSWIPPTATSSCGDLTLESNFSPGDNFPVGETLVVYNAKQGSKNVQCSFRVTVTSSEIGLVISKVLTPDGDGTNDTWRVENIDQYSSLVRIVDRWGGLIYEAENYNNSSVCWDGTSKSGSRAPTGTYFYVMKVQRAGVTEEYKGFIELIR